MRSIANQAYVATKVGAEGVMRYDPAFGSLQDFQSVVLDAEIMQADGKIYISNEHRESQSGLRQVDCIRFMRVK
jgi:hypothetical protein